MSSLNPFNPTGIQVRESIRMLSDVKLLNRLASTEKKLEKVRGCSASLDGWQTQRLAKKSRAWDELAAEKFEILTELETRGIEPVR